jgi:hypothetical protein
MNQGIRQVLLTATGAPICTYLANLPSYYLLPESKSRQLSELFFKLIFYFLADIFLSILFSIYYPLEHPRSFDFPLAY